MKMLTMALGAAALDILVSGRINNGPDRYSYGYDGYNHNSGNGAYDGSSNYDRDRDRDCRYDS